MSASAEPSPILPPAYLGDGVYLSHDGWHLWFAANHPAHTVVALDPAVFGELLAYVARHPGEHHAVLWLAIRKAMREEASPERPT